MLERTIKIIRQRTGQIQVAGDWNIPQTKNDNITIKYYFNRKEKSSNHLN